MIWTSRIPNVFRKTITFAGGSGTGAVGTVAVATITGGVQIVTGSVRCTTDLVSSGGTIEMGTASNTAGLIPQTTASALDANEFWQDATPELKVSPAITFQLVGGDIIITVASADVTAGVIEVVFRWLPESADGNLA